MTRPYNNRMGRAGQPTYDNHYWSITDTGRVECHLLENESKFRRMAIGNHFKTREEALATVERLKRRALAKDGLKWLDIAAEAEEVEDPEWREVR